MGLSIWVWPLIIVIIGIVAISYYSTVSVTKHQERQQVLDKGVQEKIQNHPFVFNPIILAYVLAALFAGVMIFYYAFVYTF